MPLPLALFEPVTLAERVVEGVEDSVGVELTLPVAEWLELCVSVGDDETLGDCDGLGVTVVERDCVSLAVCDWDAVTSWLGDDDWLTVAD